MAADGQISKSLDRRGPAQRETTARNEAVAGKNDALRPGWLSSGVTRLWMLDYYTRWSTHGAIAAVDPTKQTRKPMSTPRNG